MTGSQALNKLLNGLGHASSYDSIIRAETALAEQALREMNDKTAVPPGFRKHVPVMAVFDNIDFLEHTLSGAGTTHNTNGILVQTAAPYAESASLTPSSSADIISKRARTVQPADTLLKSYTFGKRIGPHLQVPFTSSKPSSEVGVACSLLRETAYLFMKSASPNLPGWQAFNSAIAGSPLPMSAIHYLPVIEAPPTQMETIQHILQYTANLAERFEIPALVLVGDQAVYAKVKEVQWKNDNLKKKVVSRLGEFHLTMAFLAVIGKRFQHSGLEDILVEAGIVAPGSIAAFVQGKPYNRSMRAHRLLYEALGRLQAQEFLEACNAEDREAFSSLVEHTLQTHSQAGKLDTAQWPRLQTSWKEHRDKRCAESPTYSLWNSYQDMVALLLTLLRATRESNWQQHLHAVRLILPWFFIYDRINYARYATTYWCEMEQLPETHPWIYEQFQQPGVWTVQRNPTHGFTAVAADQAIEQTVNRDSKMAGGVKTITLTPGATQRWVLSRPAKAAITRKCKEMAGTTEETLSGRSRWYKDETSDVIALQSAIQDAMNPWTVDHDKLLCITSGCVASEELALDLLSAYECGEKLLSEFASTHLLGTSKDIFSPLKLSKSKTFASTDSSKASKEKPRVKSDSAVFARLLVVAEKRNMNLKDILSYSLNPVALPLCSADGTSLCKTNKAALLSALEIKCASNDVANADVSLVKDCALIVDAMAFIQGFPRNMLPPTFGDLADLLLAHLIRVGESFNAVRVDFVGDRYPTTSIKSLERQRRGHDHGKLLHVYNAAQKLPKQWAKFLAVGSNKENLLTFLCRHWKTVTLPKPIMVFVTEAEKCYRLVFVPDCLPTTSEVSDLTTDQEEADTRLLLHAHHAAGHACECVVVRSPDTDVALLCLHHVASILKPLYLSIGTGGKARLLDIRAMRQALGSPLCEALLGLHAFTGCDTTSAFYGKGKKRCLKAVVDNTIALQALASLGNSTEASDDVISQMEEIACRVYGCMSTNMTDARYAMFCTGAGSEKTLPPTTGALRQHTMRASYQAALWKRALQQDTGAPSPHNHGWSVLDDEICLVWSEEPQAPADILPLVTCSCSSSGCERGRCSCRKQMLPCTDLCKCKGCKNIRTETNIERVEEVEEDDGDEED